MLLLLQIWLDLAGELDGERVALAVDRLADGDADPALAHAIFLDVGFFLAVELDADAAAQQRLVVVGALGIGRQTVGQGCLGHGLTIAIAPRECRDRQVAWCLHHAHSVWRARSAPASSPLCQSAPSSSSTGWAFSSQWRRWRLRSQNMQAWVSGG